jgi:hypothetical protein
VFILLSIHQELRQGCSPLSYTRSMANKPTPKPKSDQQLEEFIKAGGRPNAEADFNRILQKAVPPTKPQTPKK